MSRLPTTAPPFAAETQPFWEAAAAGKLRLPRCDDCGLVIFYPRSICPKCRSRAIRWIDLSGRGTVYSYTVTRRTAGRWREHTPFVVAYVELEEGPRLLTNIVGCDPKAVAIGLPVIVVFDATDGGGAIPRFAPAAGS